MVQGANIPPQGCLSLDFFYMREEKCLLFKSLLFIFYVNFKNVFIITFLSMGKCYLRKKMIVDIFLNKSIRGRRRRG